MKKIVLVAIATLTVVLTSCGLKPVVSDYDYLKTDVKDIDLDDLGNGNILFYNGANILHKLDDTARLNIWVDAKAVGQLKPNEFVIINLQSGSYPVNLLHIDVFNMKSDHEIVVDKDTKIVKVKPTLTSNKLWITNEFPSNWHKFVYAKKS